jgi:branched-chain amino acid transport system permease protein
MIQDLLIGLAQGGIYALTGVGLVLIFSVVRVPNFAHGEPVMLGAMLTVTLVTSAALPIPLAIVVGVLGSALLGWLFSVAVFGPLLRRSETSLLIISLALVVIIGALAVKLWGDSPVTTPGSPTTILHMAGAQVPLTWVMIFVASILCTVAVDAFIRFTAPGRVMRAMALNPFAASLMGIPVRRYQGLAFIIGSALAGLGGGLFSLAFAVQATMGSHIALKAFIVIIFAGMGSVWGALAGGMLLGIAESFGASYISSGYRDTFGFIFLLAVLLIRPNGLFASRIHA